MTTEIFIWLVFLLVISVFMLHNTAIAIGDDENRDFHFIQELPQDWTEPDEGHRLTIYQEYKIPQPCWLNLLELHSTLGGLSSILGRRKSLRSNVCDEQGPAHILGELHSVK
ncbi:hypothetical protein LSH36_311g01005 [Paralvinella palmiformis]|uniref:Uncharacterized protein n=1 Tax=Paralvinella palmiformis TaxID=53620 RepID=A0AAD9JHS1_9ANNE|nr:hypothetical protein LSH36_311g01005 [Paralvinella palmiformis]